jgi:DNA polymerase-3 subunit alpha
MKAHYPGEYMASVLTHNINDIKKITFFIEECRRMGIEVLPPDINESGKLFAVNPEGQIRFGLSAIKGVGSAVVDALIEERNENGPFESLFDLTTRLADLSLNRKTLESLAYAGALDCFGIKRYQLLLPVSGKDEGTVLDRAVQYGRKVMAEKNSKQVSLFGGDTSESGGLEEPAIPIGTMRDGKVVEAWTRLQELNFEKDVIGFYLSGHPLERYKWQIESFTTSPISEIEEYQNREVKIAGIVTKAAERISRRGNKFMTFTIEDFSGAIELALFGDLFVQFRNFIMPDEMVFITGKFQPRYNDPDEYELKVNNIQMMSEDLFEKMIKHLMVVIDSKSFDSDMLKTLEEMVANHPGQFPLKFKLRDRELGTLDLVSADSGVLPNQKVISTLKGMGVGYKLV